jgi:hypothetical protein
MVYLGRAGFVLMLAMIRRMPERDISGRSALRPTGGSAK